MCSKDLLKVGGSNERYNENSLFAKKKILPIEILSICLLFDKALIM